MAGVSARNKQDPAHRGAVIEPFGPPVSLALLCSMNWTIIPLMAQYRMVITFLFRTNTGIISLSVQCLQMQTVAQRPLVWQGVLGMTW